MDGVIPITKALCSRPPRRRRYIPLAVRLFAATLLVLGIGSALCIAVPACRQYLAIREIRRLGGTIDFVDIGPRWLRRAIGDAPMRPFDEVRLVNLKATKADDATLLQMSAFPHMTWLILDGTKVTDAGLSNLNEHTELNWLFLENTAVTDAGLRRLVNMPKLELLSIEGTRVTTSGIRALFRATGRPMGVQGTPLDQLPK